MRPAAPPYCWAGSGVWIPHRFSTDSEIEVVLLSLDGETPDPPLGLLRHRAGRGKGVSLQPVGGGIPGPGSICALH